MYQKPGRGRLDRLLLPGALREALPRQGPGSPAMKGTLEGTECHYIILIIIIISVMLMVDFSNMFSKLS